MTEKMGQEVEGTKGRKIVKIGERIKTLGKGKGEWEQERMKRI